jgi:hypothetical protein
VDAVIALVVDESWWFTASLTVALVLTAVLLGRHRNGLRIAPRRMVTAAMALLFAATIGVMAFGHLLAVTVKLAIGTLTGSIVLFYTIGLLLAAPASLLARHAWRLPAMEDGHQQTTVALNAWLAVTLLALGLPNFPLAVPGAVNIAYVRSSRPAVGWALAGLAAAIYLGLFAGSLAFLAGGRSFEEFSGTN